MFCLSAALLNDCSIREYRYKKWCARSTAFCCYYCVLCYRVSYTQNKWISIVKMFLNLVENHIVLRCWMEILIWTIHDLVLDNNCYSFIINQLLSWCKCISFFSIGFKNIDDQSHFLINRVMIACCCTTATKGETTYSK